MQKLKSWILTPGRRFGTGLLLVFIGTLLGSLFLPFVIISLWGMILMIMLGQYTEEKWFVGKEIDCPVCTEKTTSRLVVLESHMYPIIPVIGRRVSFPVGESYYLVCEKCLQTHVGEQDLSAMLVINRGGLAHAKKITKEEYEQLLKRQ